MNDEVTKAEQEEKPTASRGGRNLAVLGTVAVVVALVSSMVSLYIYSATGDIYLDRSRPGFIAEDEEVNTGAGETTFKFSPNGVVEEEDLSEYLEEFDKVAEDIRNAADAFSQEALGDEALNIESF